MAAQVLKELHEVLISEAAVNRTTLVGEETLHFHPRPGSWLGHILNEVDSEMIGLGSGVVVSKQVHVEVLAINYGDHFGGKNGLHF